MTTCACTCIGSVVHVHVSVCPLYQYSYCMYSTMYMYMCSVMCIHLSDSECYILYICQLNILLIVSCDCSNCISVVCCDREGGLYVCMCVCICLYVYLYVYVCIDRGYNNTLVDLQSTTYSVSFVLLLFQQCSICTGIVYWYCILVLYTGIVYQYCILVILIIQCDQWCASVNEFTEYPPSTDTTSADRATEQIDQTDSLMKQMSQKNLNALRELGSCLPEKDVKKPVTKTIQKLVTYMYMYEREKNH